MTSWISLIPPLVLFIVACVTHDVIIALWVSLLVALLLITQGDLYQTFTLFLQKSYEYFYDIDTIMLYLFLIGIGSIIALLTLIKGRYIPHEQHKKIILHSKRALEQSSL